MPASAQGRHLSIGTPSRHTVPSMTQGASVVLGVMVDAPVMVSATLPGLRVEVRHPASRR